MHIACLTYLGAFIRFLYYRIKINKKITFLELWNKTKYDQNLDYIKLSNYSLGLITGFIITIIILIYLTFFYHELFFL